MFGSRTPEQPIEERLLRDYVARPRNTDELVTALTRPFDLNGASQRVVESRVKEVYSVWVPTHGAHWLYYLTGTSFKNAQQLPNVAAEAFKMAFYHSPENQQNRPTYAVEFIESTADYFALLRSLGLLSEERKIRWILAQLPFIEEMLPTAIDRKNERILFGVLEQGAEIVYRNEDEQKEALAIQIAENRATELRELLTPKLTIL